MDKHLVRYSKFLSLVLRHRPEKIGVQLDENGWADVGDLIVKANEHGVPLTHDLLREVVARNDKQRFKLSENGRRIRASQGHSVEVDLQLQPASPPEFLYHGTAARFLESIKTLGLLPGSRRHVHLSIDEETAIKVGRRHGHPVVLVVKASEMHTAGRPFFLSDNGIWLAETVAPEFLIFPDEPV